MQIFNAKYSHAKLLYFYVLVLVLSSGCTLLENEIVLGGVSGYVVNQETQEPIEGVVVFINWQSELINFEIFYGPPVYLAETKTNKEGYFEFDDSDPIIVKRSSSFENYAPTIGFINKEYKPYLTSLSHTETGLFHKKYIPRRSSPLTFELVKETAEEIVSYDNGLTMSFFLELLDNINPYLCMPVKLPSTTEQLKMIRDMVKGKDKARISGYYIEIDWMLKNSNCSG
jgi:hypothetical protein